jgi:hypothetical protein
MLLGWMVAFYVFASLPNSYFSDYTDWDDRWISWLPMSLKGAIGGASTALAIKVTAPEVPWGRLARVVGIWAFFLAVLSGFQLFFGTTAAMSSFLDDFTEDEATTLLFHGAWMGLFYGLAAAGAMAAMINQLEGQFTRHQLASVTGSGK